MTAFGCAIWRKHSEKDGLHRTAVEIARRPGQSTSHAISAGVANDGAVAR